MGVDETLLDETRLERIEANLKAFVTNKQNTARQAAETYHQSQREITNLRDHISAFQTVYSGIGGKKADPDILDFDRHADVTIRFSMFLLATHYWEGRWLLELEKVLPALEKVRKDKRGESDRDMVEALLADAHDDHTLRSFDICHPARQDDLPRQGWTQLPD